MLHEWAHKFFCVRAGVRVLEVKYFQFDDKIAGYVRHEEPSNFWQSFLISFGPLLVNTCASVALAFAATQFLSGSAFKWVLLWMVSSDIQN